MTRFFFLVLILGSALLNGQEIKYEARDLDSEILVPVVILNANAKPISLNESSSFTLRPSDGDYFQLISENHFIKSIVIDWSAIKGKEEQTIYLQALQLNLPVLEIVEKGIRFWDTLLVDDFELLNERLLVLGDDYLVFSKLDGHVIKILRNRFSFKRLEKDPRGNVFAFYGDSVIQVYHQKDKIYFYPAFPVEDYNTYIAPLTAVIGEALVLRNARPLIYPLPISPFRAGTRGKALSHPPLHNKGIEYIIFAKGQEPKFFYRSIDTAALEAAQLAFNQYYGVAARIEKLYDEYGVLDNAKRFELDILRKQYLSYHAKFIPFPIVKRAGSFWVFDHVRQVVQEIDPERLELGKAVSFPFPKKPKEELIVSDHSSDSHFMVEEHRGMVSIYPIAENWQLDSKIEVGLFATELKVAEQKLFFISDKNYLTSKSLN